MQSAKQLLTRMADDLGLLPDQLQKIVRTAPLRYKAFQIPKRGGGMRDVAQPAREVKAIQRWITKAVGPHLPIHEAATAYRRGSSIRSNARLHVGSKYSLKLDFRAFFPSITFDDLIKHLTTHCARSFDESAIRLICYVSCWAPHRAPPLRLCIGAPSSPLLSNSIAFDFDRLVAARAQSDEVAYTRYADDLTFSCRQKDVLDAYPEVVRTILESLKYPRLELNAAKTQFGSRRVHRSVTGIVLTPDAKMSIGRERKRLIRAMYHRQRLGLLSDDDAQRLAGLTAFAEHIEKGFRKWLEKSSE